MTRTALDAVRERIEAARNNIGSRRPLGSSDPKSERYDHGAFLWDWYGEGLQALEQLERDAEDAARYRTLREQDWDTALLCVVANPKETVRLGTDCPSRERLDQMVDALRTPTPIPTPGYPHA